MSYYKPRPPFGAVPGGKPIKPVPPEPGVIPPAPVIPPGGEIPPIVVPPVGPPTPPNPPLPPYLQPGAWSDGAVLIHHGDGGKYFVYKRVGSSIQKLVLLFTDINTEFLNNVVHTLRSEAPVINHEPPNDKLSN